MPKVYALEIGIYSSKKVVGVFSTREKAEAARAAFDDEDWEVFEFDLDDKYILNFVTKHLSFYEIEYDGQGNVLSVDAKKYIDKYGYTRERVVSSCDGGMWFVNVVAASEKEAIKAGWERVMIKKASQ